MNRVDQDISRRPTLAVVDRTFLIGVPLIVATAAIAFPRGPTTSLRVLAVLLVVIWALAVLGWLGRAPWRRSLYPALVLCIAGISLSTQGPTAGVGATLGLAVLLAAALSSRIGLWCVAAAGIAIIAVHAATSSGGVESAASLRFDGLGVWIRMALVAGVLTWIAAQVLGALIESLELSYGRAALAYRSETETRVQLDSSRQELDDAEHVELVGRLAGGVAHDINNALTAILAASDLLGDKVATTGQRQSLAELEGASRHAAELVRDLLWIGRQFPPTTMSADIETTVSACLRRLDRMGRKVELDVNISPVCVALAPERLEQVLFRVLLRAHRAGVTELSMIGRRTDDMIEIEVRGIESGGTPNPTQLLWPKAVSARLGMTAAKEVIEQAGGTMTCSEGDGQLAVQLRLPLATAELPAELSPLDRPRTALVVDDEPLILGRLSKLVARRGYTVMSASSMAEAWPLLATAPDLLVTDLQLGDGRGEDLALASFERAPERPIVVCSGFGADDDLRDQLRHARVRFLTKPFTMADLDGAIPDATREVA